MYDIKELVGKRIKELRKEKALTQEELAELIGIEPRNIIKIENAQTFPRTRTLEKLLEVLEISPDNFFRFEHLDNIEVLRGKVVEKLCSDDKLTKLIYKMLF